MQRSPRPRIHIGTIVVVLCSATGTAISDGGTLGAIAYFEALFTILALAIAVPSVAVSIAYGLGRARSSVAAIVFASTTLAYACWFWRWADMILVATWAGAASVGVSGAVGVYLRRRPSRSQAASRTSDN